MLGSDHECAWRETLSLLAGIDLLTGEVRASVEDRHRSREFVAFLQKLDAAYPTSTAIKIILDNHSAHVCKETLNLVEGFLSAFAALRPQDVRLTNNSSARQRAWRNCRVASHAWPTDALGVARGGLA